MALGGQSLVEGEWTQPGAASSALIPNTQHAMNVNNLSSGLRIIY